MGWAALVCAISGLTSAPIFFGSAMSALVAEVGGASWSMWKVTFVGESPEWKTDVAAGKSSGPTEWSSGGEWLEGTGYPFALNMQK